MASDSVAMDFLHTRIHSTIFAVRGVVETLRDRVRGRVQLTGR